MRFFSDRVIDTWLQEFGYPPRARTADRAEPCGLEMAARERGPRLEAELEQHGKRLAERAQMGPTRMQGRAGVIR